MPTSFNMVSKLVLINAQVKRLITSGMTTVLCLSLCATGLGLSST
jgi:hypothetical protein